MHKTYTFYVLQNQLGKTKLPWSEWEAQQNAQTINKMKLAVRAVRWIHQTVELSYHCHVYNVLFLHLTGILLLVNFVSVALFEFSLMLCGITCVLLFKSFHPVDFNQNEFCCSRFSVINETQLSYNNWRTGNNTLKTPEGKSVIYKALILKVISEYTSLPIVINKKLIIGALIGFKEKKASKSWTNGLKATKENCKISMKEI